MTKRREKDRERGRERERERERERGGGGGGQAERRKESERRRYIQTDRLIEIKIDRERWGIANSDQRERIERDRGRDTENQPHRGSNC